MNKYTLELTEEQINIILNALANRPYFEVYTLINEIQKQALEKNEK